MAAKWFQKGRITPVAHGKRARHYAADQKRAIVGYAGGRSPFRLEVRIVARRKSSRSEVQAKQEREHDSTLRCYGLNDGEGEEPTERVNG
jgi:hypothetical protein